MESYIKNTLGLHVDIQTWNDGNTLPDELKDGKEYFLMEMCGIRCLVVKIAASDFQLSAFQRQSRKIQEYCNYPQVICFDRITAYQRKCMIENKQAFIVPDNQLYMPFLGILLQEHFKAQAIAGRQLTAMAQYILLFFLYDITQKYHSKLEISQELGINLMNVTRGVQELEELSLLITRKKGRSSMVSLLHSKQETLEAARNYLRDPIQRRMFVEQEKWLLDLPMAGREVNENSSYPVRAMEKKAYLEAANKIKSVDPNWDIGVDYMELQVWRYDPVKFTDGKTVDSISLTLSLLGDSEEAVELNIKKLCNNPQGGSTLKT